VVSGVTVERIVLPYLSRVGELRRIENKNNSFEAWGNTHPATQHHFPEDRNTLRVILLKFFTENLDRNLGA
jgi:hypothetical protein